MNECVMSRFAMTGARVQKITIQRQQRITFTCTCLRYLRFFIYRDTIILYIGSGNGNLLIWQESEVKGKPRIGTSGRK